MSFIPGAPGSTPVSRIAGGEGERGGREGERGGGGGRGEGGERGGVGVELCCNKKI